MKVGFKASELMRHITFDVKMTGLKVSKVRIWLGCKIMMLAAAVMGCNVELDMRP